MQGENFLKEVAKEKLLNNNDPKKRKEEPEDILDEAARLAKVRAADRVKMANINVTVSQLEAEAARLEEEAREIRRRIAAGEPRPSGNAEGKSTEAVQNRLIALSLHLLNEGADPATVGQILMGQSGNAPLVKGLDIGGTPKWMGELMKDLIEAKSKTDLEKVELELKHMKETFDHRLTEIAQKAGEGGGRRGADEFDPVKFATDQAKGVRAYHDTLKELGLIPERGAQIPADQTFEFQERQWTHEERKAWIEAQKDRIATEERIEARKLQQRQDTLGSTIEGIGGILAKGIQDGMMQRREQREGAAGDRPRGIPIIQIEPGEGDMVEVECAGCKQPITVMANAKSATCAACGMKYRVQMVEGQGGEESQ